MLDLVEMDSSEHRILTKCYPRLVSCIKQSPSDIAVQLRPSGILSEGDWAFLTNPHHDNDQKAIRIVDVVLNQVKTNPEVFSTFISALEAAGSWTASIVTELKARIQHIPPHGMYGDSLSSANPISLIPPMHVHSDLDSQPVKIHKHRPISLPHSGESACDCLTGILF